MKVLVTGAAGFIGAGVCTQLLTRGDTAVSPRVNNCVQTPAPMNPAAPVTSTFIAAIIAPARASRYARRILESHLCRAIVQHTTHIHSRVGSRNTPYVLQHQRAAIDEPIANRIRFAMGSSIAARWCCSTYGVLRLPTRLWMCVVCWTMARQRCDSRMRRA